MSAEPINQMNRVNLYVYKHHMPEICVGYKRLVFELHIYQNLVVFGLVYNSLDNFFFSILVTENVNYSEILFRAILSPV